jgi:hypothetical protein
MAKQKTKGLQYRVPEHIVAWAKTEARIQCRETGEPVTWSQVIRATLEAAARKER